jgi:hypothetical protein
MRAIAMWVFLVIAAGLASPVGSGVPVIACNLRAISTAKRPRYNELMKCLRLAVHDRVEMRNGYIFKLSRETMTLSEVGEWISLERLCCPVLIFQLSASGNEAATSLTLSGPAGVKPLLEEEFPVAR